MKSVVAAKPVSRPVPAGTVPVTAPPGPAGPRRQILTEVEDTTPWIAATSFLASAAGAGALAYDDNAPDAPLHGVDNVTVARSGDLYVAEDGDDMQVCLITRPRRGSSAGRGCSTGRLMRPGRRAASPTEQRRSSRRQATKASAQRSLIPSPHGWSVRYWRVSSTLSSARSPKRRRRYSCSWGPRAGACAAAGAPSTPGSRWLAAGGTRQGTRQGRTCPRPLRPRSCCRPHGRPTSPGRRRGRPGGAGSVRYRAWRLR